MWRSACGAAALWSSWSRSQTWTPARPPHKRPRQLQLPWQKLPGKPLPPAQSLVMIEAERSFSRACMAHIENP